MNTDNKQIVLLLVSGSFLVSLPFFMQNNLHKTKTLKTDTVFIKKNMKEKTKRLPASKSPYSVEDFKPKNLLNKKLLTKEQYDDAMRASKHVGVSYEAPKPELNYKLSKEDLAPVREIERAIFIAKTKQKEQRLKQPTSIK